MRKILHPWGVGDEVVYNQPYRGGNFVGKIETIGKMYATIDDQRIHIPKIKAKLLPGKDAKMLVRLLDGADAVYRRECEHAAQRRNKSKAGLYAHYCDRKVQD